MGGPVPVPPAFPTVIPNPINPNTPGFQIAAVRIDAPDEVTVFVANNLRVGDRVLVAGLRTLTSLNNQQLTILASEPSGGSMAAYAANANSFTIKNPGTIPAGLTGLINESGIVTRLGAGSRQKALFFTDPALYEPPNDNGPLIITKSVASVEHPGRMIPDVIIGSVLRVERATLTSTQILQLHQTPVQLLPEPEFVPSGLQGTPGPRLAYSVKSASFRYQAGTHPYTRGSSKLNLYLGPKDNDIEFLTDPDDVTALLEADEDKVWIGAKLNDLEAQVAGLLENKPVVIASDSAITGGNGTLTIILEFTVIQT